MVLVEKIGDFFGCFFIAVSGGLRGAKLHRFETRDFCPRSDKRMAGFVCD